MQSFRRGYVKATNSPKTSAKDPINSGKILLRVKSVFTWNTLCFPIYGRLLKYTFVSGCSSSDLVNGLR